MSTQSGPAMPISGRSQPMKFVVLMSWHLKHTGFVTHDMTVLNKTNTSKFILPVLAPRGPGVRDETRLGWEFVMKTKKENNTFAVSLMWTNGSEAAAACSESEHPDFMLGKKGKKSYDCFAAVHKKKSAQLTWWPMIRENSTDIGVHFDEHGRTQRSTELKMSDPCACATWVHGQTVWTSWGARNVKERVNMSLFIEKIFARNWKFQLREMTDHK